MSIDYKKSYYNFIIPIDENETILYNSITGGMVLLAKKEKELYTNFKKYDKLSSDQNNLIKLWVDKGYLVDNELDEVGICKQVLKNTLSKAQVKMSDTLSFTILPTNACNMQCSYCFENENLNKILGDREIANIERFVESILEKEKPFKNLSITWYGGEPLLGKKAIEALTLKFNSICDKFKLKYSASIVTNGILLDKDMWTFLQKNQISEVQITIDGDKKLHDKRRLLKQGGVNYERILNNISLMPEGIKLCIRINTDKIVAQAIPKLFDDLKKMNIWPQRFREINIDIRPLRTYSYNNEEDVSCRIPFHEFEGHLFQLRKLKLDYCNNWLGEKSPKKGKLKFELPKNKITNLCQTVYNPYYLVIDPEGYTYNCWEYVGNKEKQLFNVKEGFDIKKALNGNELSTCLRPGCESCKFLPVCNAVSCPQIMFELNQCAYKEEQFVEVMRNQYLFYRENPDLMVIQDETQ